MLFEYMRQIQRFTRDQNQVLLNPEDLISYINRSRRDLAGRTQCLRALPPISGGISAIQVDTGGTGYTDPTVTITAPDSPSGYQPYPNGLQATASASVAGGVITDVLVTNGGAGYFEPIITISDPTGTGATASLAGTIGWQTISGQEVYRFSDIDLSQFPGYESVIAVRSVSMLFNNFRYSLPCYSFSTYQALIRQYQRLSYYVPAVFAQYGQGTEGTIYAYPLPNQAYGMEWDCWCYPSDLIDDNSVEAIPVPWRDAVPYFSAHLCYLELQNYNAASYYLTLYEKMVSNFSRYARPGQIGNPYGRVF